MSTLGSGCKVVFLRSLADQCSPRQGVAAVEMLQKVLTVPIVSEWRPAQERRELCYLRPFLVVTSLERIIKSLPYNICVACLSDEPKESTVR